MNRNSGLKCSCRWNSIDLDLIDFASSFDLSSSNHGCPERCCSGSCLRCRCCCCCFCYRYLTLGFALGWKRYSLSFANCRTYCRCYSLPLGQSNRVRTPNLSGPQWPLYASWIVSSLHLTSRLAGSWPPRPIWAQNIAAPVLQPACRTVKNAERPDKLQKPFCQKPPWCVRDRPPCKSRSYSGEWREGGRVICRAVCRRRANGDSTGIRCAIVVAPDRHYFFAESRCSASIRTSSDAWDRSLCRWSGRRSWSSWFAPAPDNLILGKKHQQRQLTAAIAVAII